MDKKEQTAEEIRLQESNTKQIPWRLWGPYLSERQWGTVREDDSADGDAWSYFPHDHARSRAYRWGEDGIAGICDDQQQLCFALALWNGKDPILKERLFGLTGKEGNHGEDVKEYYFYLDNLPSHAYMKYLYKYPQEVFPYQDLVETNQKRNRQQPEYELLDTHIFDEDRYFDLFVEYAKASPKEIYIKITVMNRAAQPASLQLLPTLWFRNDWSWQEETKKSRPYFTSEKEETALCVAKSYHPSLDHYWLYCEQAKELLFTENETNSQRLFDLPCGPFVKDGIHNYIVHSQKEKVNPKKKGSKMSALYSLQFQAHEEKVIKLVLTDKNFTSDYFSSEFDALFQQRKKEADQFYASINPFPIPEEQKIIQRQAFAGLLWNKQCYHYNVSKWLKSDHLSKEEQNRRKRGRNHNWTHLDAFDVISVPDKWEFPWFASWDLSFHAVSFALIDPQFAKEQLLLLTKEWYMAPNGQLPAYEWNFSDVNPPTQVWAALAVYHLESEQYRKKDRLFLEKIFQKLLLNFTWWVNQEDVEGKNIFEGGFLGLDNIGAFDRSQAALNGAILEQRDGTGWMGMYCLKMVEMALELALQNSVYEEMAVKFFEHFVAIADAINAMTHEQIKGLWDEKEGFYYSTLIAKDGTVTKIRENSLSGMIPLFAVALNDSKELNQFSHFKKQFEWFIKNKNKSIHSIVDFKKRDGKECILLTFVNDSKLKLILKLLLDEAQLLSPYGIRSVSKKYANQPFSIQIQGEKYQLDYEPAESTTALFGGNSNWRGPIWFPLNYLLIESLNTFYRYYGDDFLVEFPTGSNHFITLQQLADQLSQRLLSIFLKDSQGRRPLYGQIEKFQQDPHWKEYILFHEYFHGDNGAGLGASNQTGWTALIANLIHQQSKKPNN